LVLSLIAPVVVDLRSGKSLVSYTFKLLMSKKSEVAAGMRLFHL